MPMSLSTSLMTLSLSTSLMPMLVSIRGSSLIAGRSSSLFLRQISVFPAPYSSSEFAALVVAMSQASRAYIPPEKVPTIIDFAFATFPEVGWRAFDLRHVVEM